MYDLAKNYVLIVAGGKGKRMGSDIPKQFMEINNYPVILHTINKFLHALQEMELIVVLPDDYFPYWKKMIRNYEFSKDHKLVKGGPERFFSVKNALQTLNDDGIIAIHDAVRPLVEEKVIMEAFKYANVFGSAVPAIPVLESVRRIKENKSYPVNRNDLLLIQTPQAFRLSLIKKAYEVGYTASFTDDASVYEAAGNNIHLIGGNKENIKITAPSDLTLASAYLEIK